MGYTTTQNEKKKKLSQVSDAKTNLNQTAMQKSYHGQSEPKGNTKTVGEVVRVTDYAPPAGVVNPQYSARTGNVLIDGIPVPTTEIENGRAYVEKSALEKAYQAVLDRHGIKTAGELSEEWNQKYQVPLEERLLALENRRPWNYNPQNDPAYQAYKKMYEREGKLAYRDALAGMSAKNQGNLSAAALTIANQQLGQYLSKLSDRVPELQKNAYARYVGDYDMDYKTYQALSEHAKREGERMQAENEQKKADVLGWYERERERTENRQADERFQSEQRADAQALAEGERAYLQAKKDSAWENAKKRGYFSWEEIQLLNIAQNEDGTYPTPQDIMIHQERRQFEEIEKQKLDYENWLAQVLALAKIGAEAEETRQTKKQDYENQARSRSEQYQYNSKLKSQQHQYNKELAKYKEDLKMAAWE